MQNRNFTNVAGLASVTGMTTTPLAFLPTLAAGFGLGLSLIIAIGAQNAYVLQRGIRREHVLAVVVLCAVSDAVLIALGVLGIGAVIERFPAVIGIVRWGGAAFLIGYGLLAAGRVFRARRLDSGASDGRGSGSAAVGPSLATTIATVLALTWLNPHVYLDTVLLLGSVANGYGHGELGDSGRWIFGAGAMIASVVWFSALGFGSRYLAGLFTRPVAWRVLDGIIAVTMIALGVQLILKS